MGMFSSRGIFGQQTSPASGTFPNEQRPGQIGPGPDHFIKLASAYRPPLAPCTGTAREAWAGARRDSSWPWPVGCWWSGANGLCGTAAKWLAPCSARLPKPKPGDGTRARPRSLLLNRAGRLADHF